MKFVTKAALRRRTFLRGLGTTLALPLLDAMVPALSAKSVSRTPRLGFIYIANGVIQDHWNPRSVGPNFDLPPILKPLGALKDQVNILSDLSHLQADTFGDGTGDHPRASAAWLTGVHAYDRTQPGVEVKLATTADQTRGEGNRQRDTARFARTDGRFSDAGRMRFRRLLLRQHHFLAQSDHTESNGDAPPGCVRAPLRRWRQFDAKARCGGRYAQHPRFGAAGDEAGSRARWEFRTSTKLNEYLDSVREIETRIQNVEAKGQQAIELPDRPIDIPERFDDYVKLMFDLQALAFRADITRVFSMIMARELSSRTFAQIGVPDQHHAVSHHRNDPDLIAKKAKIDTYHMQLFTYFLQKLHDTPDGDGSLLDHSLILYGGGMGNGNLHRHTDLPCLLAGKLGGQIQTGRHLVYPQDTPMTNLLLAILEKAGVKIDKLGDSTGVIQPNPLNIS